MKTIHKQPLQIQDVQEIEIPEGSEFLCVKEQYLNEDPSIWYLCDPSKRLINKTIYCHGTGHNIDKEYTKYLGTIFKLNGRLVFHFFLE